MDRHRSAGEPRGPMQRDAKEVLADSVGKLREKLDPKKAAAASAGEEHLRGELRRFTLISIV